ncbi:hypothetical protein NX059_004609 [Plenodomus lindquistii]|nr:hypothetical protein NX059_004609 [Plenodomus lindquistii]
MDDATDSSNESRTPAAWRRLSDSSRRKLQNKLANEAYLHKLQIRRSLRNEAPEQRSDTTKELSGGLNMDLEEYHFHAVLEGTQPSGSSGSREEEDLKVADERATTPSQSFSQHQQQNDFQQRVAMQQHQQSLANLEYLRRLSANPLGQQMQCSLANVQFLERGWKFQEQRANEQFMASVLPTAQQRSANVQFMSSLPSLLPESQAQLRTQDSSSSKKDTSGRGEQSTMSLSPALAMDYDSLRVEPQSPVENSYHLKRWSVSNKRSGNTHFLSSLPPRSPQLQLHPSSQERRLQLMDEQMAQERNQMRQQKVPQQLPVVLHSTDFTASSPPSQSTPNNVVQPSTASFEIYRGHGTPASASLRQPLEASSTSIPLDSPTDLDRPAADAELRDLGKRSTVRRNMHFANVSFLRQLQSLEREASGQETSGGSPMLPSQLTKVDTVSEELPMGRKKRRRPMNSDTTGGMEERDDVNTPHNFFTFDPINPSYGSVPDGTDPTGSSYTGGPIHDYEVFKQSGFSSTQLFHNLQGYNGPSDDHFFDFAAKHDASPGATSRRRDSIRLKKGLVSGLDTFGNVAPKFSTDQFANQSSATLNSNSLLYNQDNVDGDNANMQDNLSIANAHFFYDLNPDQVSLVASLAMDRRHPQSKPSTSTTFVYPGLLSSTNSIRLLQIEPASEVNNSDDIHCTLKSVEPWISDMHYECLSYCWGAQTGGKRIFIRAEGNDDYEPMEVTENLFGALKGLRNSLKPTLHWIDAICIDQTNDTERGEQVGLMKEIYSKASGVIVWLGPSTPRLAAAVDIMNDISRRFQHDTTISPGSIINPLGLSFTDEDTAHLQSYNEYSYEDVAHFFALPWFRRVWVLQEALAQTSITVRIGTRCLPWGSVILAALWQAQFTRSYTAKSTTDADGVGAHQFLPELWLGLLHTRMPRGLSMIELASRARDFKATDPRDKVFALLGLANDVGPLSTRPSGLIPDYSKTTVEVYTNFAKSIILKTRKLDVLSMVNTFPSHTGTQGFVSWMPNLDASVATIRGFGFPNKYNASYSTDIDTAITSSNANELHMLKLSGHIIDTAQTITEDMLFFTRDLKLYLGHSTDAITHFWRTHIAPTTTPVSEKQRLNEYIELLTAAGFALPTEFPAQPLGKVVASRHVPSIIADFAAYWARRDPGFSDFSEDLARELREHAKRGDADQFGVLTGKACHERKFFITAAGRMGLCPLGTRVGDGVVVLYGGSVLYVLRAASDGEWRFVGECYVDGVMFGEARELKEREEVFCIV